MNIDDQKWGILITLKKWAEKKKSRENKRNFFEILKLDESNKNCLQDNRLWYCFKTDCADFQGLIKKLKAEYLHAGSYQGQITSGKRVGA